MERIIILLITAILLLPSSHSFAEDDSAIHEDVENKVRAFLKEQGNRFSKCCEVTEILKQRFDYKKRDDRHLLHVEFEYVNSSGKKETKGTRNGTFVITGSGPGWQIKKEIAACGNCLRNAPLHH